MKNNFNSKFLVAEKQTTENVSLDSGIQPNAKQNDVPESDFKARFCTEQISQKKLYKSSCFADQLTLVPFTKRALGMGMDLDMGTCLICLRKDGVKYLLDINGDSSQVEGFEQIPANMIFVFVHDAEKAFVILQNSEGESEIYELDEDSEISVYLETEPYKKRNRFYACVLRQKGKGVCMTNVTTNPRTGELFCRLVASEIED